MPASAQPPRYQDLPAEQLREQYWAWRRLLDNALRVRAARSASRCLRQVELLQRVARTRRIPLTPARESR
jgi:hypothetical protein